MSEIVLGCEALCRTFILGDERLEVLRGVDLQVAAGESVAITGESGCGKSTLLYLLGGLDKADAGKVHTSSTAFIFQFHHLLPRVQRAGKRGHAHVHSGHRWCRQACRRTG